jgi:hypothetical protein
MTTEEIQARLNARKNALCVEEAKAIIDRKKIERAESLLREYNLIRMKVRLLEADIMSILEGRLRPSEINPFGAGEGTCSNAWPASKWEKPVAKVIEVTGKKAGAYVGQRWFSLDKAESAKKHLLTLDQGNAWISEAWVADQRVVTGRRKRVQLNHPHAIERKAVYEL